MAYRGNYWIQVTSPTAGEVILMAGSGLYTILVSGTAGAPDTPPPTTAGWPPINRVEVQGVIAQLQFPKLPPLPGLPQQVGFTAKVPIPVVQIELPAPLTEPFFINWTLEFWAFTAGVGGGENAVANVPVTVRIPAKVTLNLPKL